MKYKILVYVICLFVALSLLLLACNNTATVKEGEGISDNPDSQEDILDNVDEPEKDEIILTVAIDGGPCTYIFTITQSGIYEALRGYRPSNHIDLSNVVLSPIDERETRQLTTVQLDNLLSMADKIEQNKESLKYRESTYTWIILIYYNETLYVCNYTLGVEDIPVYLVRDLVDQLRAFSSFETPENMRPVPEHLIKDNQ